MYCCSYDTRWSYSQVFGEVNPNALVTPFPNADDNTIVHMVTAAGNTEVFEVNPAKTNMIVHDICRLTIK